MYKLYTKETAVNIGITIYKIKVLNSTFNEG